MSGTPQRKIAGQPMGGKIADVITLLNERSADRRVYGIHKNLKTAFLRSFRADRLLSLRSLSQLNSQEFLVSQLSNFGKVELQNRFSFEVTAPEAKLHSFKKFPDTTETLWNLSTTAKGCNYGKFVQFRFGGCRFGQH